MKRHMISAIGGVAQGLGYTVRFGRWAARYAPGWIGAGLVAWGAAMAWLPLGLMVGGAFLIAMDALIPARGRGGE